MRRTSIILWVIFCFAGLNGCGHSSPAGAPKAQGAAGGSHPALTRMADLPGYTTPAQFDRGAALTAADLQFYLQVMPAAIARMHHPPPADQAALAYFQKWQAAGAQAAQSAAAAMKAGNYAAAANAANAELPRTAQVDLAQTLQLGNADSLVAAARGMPDEQWSYIKGRVEAAAAPPCSIPLPSPNVPNVAVAFDQWTGSCFGGSGSNDFRGVNKAGMLQADAEAVQAIHTILAERSLVAPYAAQVRNLHLQYVCSIPGPIGQGQCNLARMK